MSLCVSNIGKISPALPIGGYNGPLLVKVGGSSGYFASLGPIVGIKGARSVLAQVQNTFDKSLYITPFGEKPGTVEITVVAPKRCAPLAATSDPDFIGFFTKNMFQGGKPTTIAIGKGVLNAILFGQSFSMDADTLYPAVTFTFVVWAASSRSRITFGNLI